MDAAWVDELGALPFVRPVYGSIPPLGALRHANGLRPLPPQEAGFHQRTCSVIPREEVRNDRFDVVRPLQIPTPFGAYRHTALDTASRPAFPPAGRRNRVVENQTQTSCGAGRALET